MVGLSIIPEGMVGCVWEMACWVEKERHRNKHRSLSLIRTNCECGELKEMNQNQEQEHSKCLASNFLMKK